MNVDYETAKYRVKISHFTEQGFMPKGVIHVGAHNGEEVQYYQMMGIQNILCFEPLPSIVEAFREEYPEVRIEQLALSNKTQKRKFYKYQDGRQGQSSSFFPVEIESSAMTGEKFTNIIVNTMRFDEWVTGKHIKLENYDCVVIDVQGAEVEVLEGMGAWVEFFKYYNIECSEKATYQGGATAKQVVAFMNKHGFTQDSKIVIHDDVFFIRKDIKKESDKVYHGRA